VRFGDFRPIEAATTRRDNMSNGARTEKIVGHCATCNEPLTEGTVFIGDHALFCPVHAFWARKRPEERAQIYVCVECGDVVLADEVWMGDDGARCECCGRHQRIMAEAA